MTVVLTPPSRSRSRDRGRRLTPWALAAVVLAGQGMASLDTAIVNVGGPSLQHDLHLSGPTLQLVVYSYVLVYAVGLILGARLGARYGFGRAFTSGTAVFTVSSLACGLAVTPAMLVVARATQGMGAALLVPQVLSLLQSTFHGQRRRRALSLYGLVLAVGVAAGQVLGGILVSADLFGTGWRPIFLVNVPVGLTVLACSVSRIPSGPTTAHRRLDLAGAALLATAVLAIIVPLTFGAGTGWPWWYWPTLAASGVALLVFAGHEARLARTLQGSLVDPTLFAERDVRTGLAGIFTLMACYGGLLFITALYLQRTLHDSALRSGLTFAGYAAGFAIASLAWSRLPATWHFGVPAAGFATIVAATAALAWTTSSGGWPPQATVLLGMAGAGHGAGFGALVQRTAGSIPAEHATSFSGVVSTINQLAVVFGIALAGTLYLSLGPSASTLPAMSSVLVALAGAQILAGTAVSTALVHSGAAPAP